MHSVTFGDDDVKRLLKSISSKSRCSGLEYHSFKIKWYNDCVQKRFALPYHEDVVAFAVISNPLMFENLLLPYIKSEIGNEIRDPVDAAISHHLTRIKEELGPNYDIDIIHDYEVTPTRRPKILVQTAAHLAGAAYYYQRSDVKIDPWGDRTINGVCVHPKYGGWFAMRGALIFKNVLCPNLQKQLPPDCVPSDEQRIELLEKFNFSWQDCSFRDVIPVEMKYSPLQRLYFETKPADRRQMLIEWTIA